MGEHALTLRDVEDIFDGEAVVDRADLSNVLELAAFMRASGEVEPPPPMSDALLWQIADGAPFN
ncbi:MAG TPA: hypothetical protein VFI47_09530 [Acidimicrobiales bacterium]|nr:hypothetical protein [Acidimicrobiales bacterium]